MNIVDGIASCLASLASAQNLMVSMTRPKGEWEASRLGSAWLAVKLALSALPTQLGAEEGRRPDGGLLSPD